MAELHLDGFAVKISVKVQNIRFAVCLCGMLYRRAHTDIGYTAISLSIYRDTSGINTEARKCPFNREKLIDGWKAEPMPESLSLTDDSCKRIRPVQHSGCPSDIACGQRRTNL